jgi:adenylylsulfate reductase subunit B
MPTFVRPDQCDGCIDQEQAVCVYICPHDLMRLDRDGSETGHAGKAYNQEPEQCWECYACVKACPRQAIEVRHYADLVPLGASVQPVREADCIAWGVGFRNGSSKRFKFPTRTTAAGSIDPYAGKPAADLAEIEGAGFFTTHGEEGLHEADSDQLIRR